jgi:hypothetical protein
VVTINEVLIVVSFRHHCMIGGTNIKMTSCDVRIVCAIIVFLFYCKLQSPIIDRPADVGLLAQTTGNSCHEGYMTCLVDSEGIVVNMSCTGGTRRLRDGPCVTCLNSVDIPRLKRYSQV